MMRWLAIHFGKKIEWNGPTVFGVGYKWCGKIWFPYSEIEKIMHKMKRSDFHEGLLCRFETLKDFFKFVGGKR